MALMVILLAALGRSTRTMLAALLDWSVSALFGERHRDGSALGLVVAAALWPFVALGVLFPRAAAYLVTLIPLPASAPLPALRVMWAVLALAIPVAMGVALCRRAEPEGVPEILGRRILRGFPITLALGAAFFLLALSRPAMRLLLVLRRRPHAALPEAGALPDIVRRLAGIVRRNRVEIVAAQPSIYRADTPPEMRATTLRLFGGEAARPMAPRGNDPTPGTSLGSSRLAPGLPAACALLTASMLLVAVSLLLGTVLPAWGAALAVAGGTALVGVVSARAGRAGYRDLTIWPRVGSPRATGFPSAM